MEDRFSQDNMSHNNLRDSSNGYIRNKNANAASVNSLGGKNEIIPERRRKYLAGGSDDNHGTTANTSQQAALMDELYDDSK